MTERQKRFCAEYLIDLNAARAARDAGYSRKSAKNSCFLLKNPEIKEFLDKAIQKQMIRTEISADRVIQELAAIAFAKATDFIAITDSETGQGDKRLMIQNTGDMNDKSLSAVVGIKESTKGIEIKFADKLKALELLGRHCQIFGEKSEAVDAAVFFRGEEELAD